MITRMVDFGPVYRTRYAGLNYQRQGEWWRLLDASTIRPVGPAYSTRIELLGDVERIARVWGLETYGAGS